MEPIHEYAWQAIVTNSTAYDGRLYYAVKTTGIYCRLSCKSRLPRREHVQLFESASLAVEAGYRPCKRCRPDRLLSPEKEWVMSIASWLEAHYASSITLERLAKVHHGSVYHLQRTFKRWMGVTPAEYVKSVRVEAVKRLLEQPGMTITEAAYRAGFGNAGHCAAVFHRETGMTPSEYRTKGRTNYVDRQHK